LGSGEGAGCRCIGAFRGHYSTPRKLLLLFSFGSIFEISTVSVEPSSPCVPLESPHHPIEGQEGNIRRDLSSAFAMASAGQSSPPSSSDLKLPAPVASKPHLLCSYCAKHNFAITEAFLAKSAEHCKSCGVDTEKENKKAAAAQAAAAQRSAAWGVTLPAEFVTTLGSNGNPSAIGRRTSHSPTVHGAWLPSWLLVAASSRGVSFDDPAVPAKTTMAASAEVYMLL